MESISPILIAAVVVLVVGGIGLVLHLRRERETYAGYEEIAGELKKITRIIAGEVHRDGNDLVVTGEYKKGPTILRFSNAENTPGLHIEVRLPSTFHLTVSPKSAPENKFGHKVKLSLWLEQRFVSRSKDPEDIELLMTQRAAAGILER